MAKSYAGRVERLVTRIIASGAHLGVEATLGDALSVALSIERSDKLAQHQAYVRILRLVEEGRKEIAAAYSGGDAVNPDGYLDDVLGPYDAIREVLLGNSIHSKARVLPASSAIHQLVLSVERFAPRNEPGADAISRAKEMLARIASNHHQR